jgi:hypothetical protein
MSKSNHRASLSSERESPASNLKNAFDSSGLKDLIAHLHDKNRVCKERIWPPSNLGDRQDLHMHKKDVAAIRHEAGVLLVSVEHTARCF